MYYFENRFKYSRGMSIKFVCDALWIFFCNQEDAYMYYIQSGFKYSGGISMIFFFCHQERAYMYYVDSGFKYSGGISMKFFFLQSGACLHVLHGEWI